MAIIHKTISAIAVAAVTAAWGAASSTQAQQPSNPIVKPPSLGAGIAQPTINPRIGQPVGIGQIGGIGRVGPIDQVQNYGFGGGGYQPYYNQQLPSGNYGHYPLAPFDYPNIVPEYSSPQ
jgi:hypothetical protein